MSPFVAELVGTAMLVLLGDALAANVRLQRTSAHGAPWTMLPVGWGLAACVAALCAGGATLHPSVTLGLCAAGSMPWAKADPAILAQLLGAFLGSTLVWLAWLPCWSRTQDAAEKLQCFASRSRIHAPLGTLSVQALGGAVLAFGGLAVRAWAAPGSAQTTSPAILAMAIGLIALTVGLSLGGRSGYAFHPAREIASRFAHGVLPIAGKGCSEWKQAWVFVVGPLAGGVMGGWIARLVGLGV